jgi:two-component system cell cycle response regulator DivK
MFSGEELNEITTKDSTMPNGEGSEPKKSILLVEDDPMNVRLLRVLLADDGYDLRAVLNAEEALKVLTTFKPDLIITDIQLPGKSGLELTQELRGNPEKSTSRIVALTAEGGKDAEQTCLNAGCDGYIVKPVDTSTFPAIVRSYLDKKSRTLPKEQGDRRDLLRGIRNTFFTESLSELATLMSTGFQADRARILRALHRWAGIAATLGMPAVTDQARRVEALVESRVFRESGRSGGQGSAQGTSASDHGGYVGTGL